MDFMDYILGFSIAIICMEFLNGILDKVNKTKSNVVIIIRWHCIWVMSTQIAFIAVKYFPWALK